MHVPQAQKSSDQVSRRELARRTAQMRDIGNTISGGQVDTHVVHHVKQKVRDERNAVIQEALGKELRSLRSQRGNP